MGMAEIIVVCYQPVLDVLQTKHGTHDAGQNVWFWWASGSHIQFQSCNKLLNVI